MEPTTAQTIIVGIICLVGGFIFGILFGAWLSGDLPDKEKKVV